MAKAFLIHWYEREAAERAGRLQALGYEVGWELPAGGGPKLFRMLADDPPAAIIIDLSRLPSQGREIGISLRQRAGTRYVPLVYVGGAPDKVAAIRQLLPDATYTTWEEIATALAQATASPPAQPVVLGSAFAAYTGRPLAQKLGIRAGARVVLHGAPESLTLGPLPARATVARDAAGPRDVTLWFVRSVAELESGMASVAPHAASGRLWILWPKKTSGVATDLGHGVVQRAGLAAGLMDYKVCAVDETWSGLCFTVPKAGRKT